MKALSICSGLDGFGYAAMLLGIEVVAHIEIEEILHYHLNHYWPNSNKFYDLRTTDSEQIPSADIIFGGEPCQGNSIAGNREGKSYDGYLWPDYFRIVKEKRPTWVVNENVVGSIGNLVLDTKIADLESIGYTCQAFNIPACAVGAVNERKRVWLVAHSNSQRSYSIKNSPRKKRKLLRAVQAENIGGKHLLTKPTRGASGRIFPYPVGGLQPVANDVPNELAAIKAYGNSVNPWIPYVILDLILQIS